MSVLPEIFNIYEVFTSFFMWSLKFLNLKKTESNQNQLCLAKNYKKWLCTCCTNRKCITSLFWHPCSPILNCTVRFLTARFEMKLVLLKWNENGLNQLNFICYDALNDIRCLIDIDFKDQIQNSQKWCTLF